MNRRPAIKTLALIHHAHCNASSLSGAEQGTKYEGMANQFS